MSLHSDRRYTFPAPRHAVWDAMASVDRYPQWWPWLRRFDAVALAVGERWTCTIRAPIPYPVRFTLDLVDIVPAQRVAAIFSGDLEGTAAFTLTDPARGCELHLRCDLEAVRGPAAFVSRWLPGVTGLCHDHILDVGLRRFRAQVADRSSPETGVSAVRSVERPRTSPGSRQHRWRARATTSGSSAAR